MQTSNLNSYIAMVRVDTQERCSHCDRSYVRDFKLLEVKGHDIDNAAIEAKLHGGLLMIVPKGQEFRVMTGTTVLV